jgi:hypothetical protein
MAEAAGGIRRGIPAQVAGRVVRGAFVEVRRRCPAGARAAVLALAAWGFDNAAIAKFRAAGAVMRED